MATGIVLPVVMAQNSDCPQAGDTRHRYLAFDKYVDRVSDLQIERQQPMTDKVLLTGVTGYIGQHVAAELLNAGYEVVGTVRSQSKVPGTLEALGAVAPTERLRFAEADLTSDDGWDAAMEGVNLVVHVASPFYFTEPSDENDLIAPAVDGTTRVIRAAQRAGVRRTVLTSSTVAVISGRGSGRFGPDSWSDTDANIGAYAKSKTLAEKKAWELVEGTDMELVVVNPGGVFGPSLGAEIDGQSVAMMRDMIGGKFPMIPDLAIGMVDVRDVATLHVRALTAPNVVGQRFIAASAEPVSMATVASTLREAGYDKAPSRRAPTPLLKVLALFDKDLKGMVPLLGRRAELDNSATVNELGWTPTPVKDSILDMARSLSDA